MSKLKDLDIRFRHVLHRITTQCNAIVAGGFARDLAHGVLGNDVDVWVTGRDRQLLHEYLGRLFLNLGYTLEESAELYGDVRELEMLHKLRHPVLPSVDLLCVGRGTVHEVVDDFDYNINKYALLNYDGELFPAFVGAHHGILVPTPKRVVSDARRKHIESIAFRYHWTGGINHL